MTLRHGVLRSVLCTLAIQLAAEKRFVLAKLFSYAYQMPRSRRIPLATLPAFRAVARLGSVRAAAEELHLTHSAISQQIRQLEEQVGFDMFERRGRRVVLNAAGTALLRSIEPALTQIDDGVRAAQALACGEEQQIRLTLLPSFAQRWLLPRMAAWRELHPGIALELDTSHRIVDLQREGMHCALRQGAGQWPGLVAERLADSALIVVGPPQAALRLRGRGPQALAQEPLLGEARLWNRWFAQAGLKVASQPVASFNDAGLMLQATEQGLGITLARELLAADALADGRLVRLAPQTLADDAVYAYWIAYPSALADWKPLLALRRWLHEEMARSEQRLRATTGTLPASRTRSRSRAASAARERPRAG
jgi:LysR family transcriptional regulator, glycine cleavage system transcriptional activator